MNSKFFDIYFEWDTLTWSRSLKIWEKELKTRSGARAIDIGSRRGGLSLMLANEFNMEVVCSDLSNPIESASVLHDKFPGVRDRITYDAVDCTNIPYADNSFDVVVFKSVIGALGAFEQQQVALKEMHRILKPGGVLLFAENLNASKLHMFLRRRFNKWSSYWRYPAYEEMSFLLSDFTSVQSDTTGFFATFARKPVVRSLLTKADVLVDLIVPVRLRYLVYGAAVK